MFKRYVGVSFCKKLFIFSSNSKNHIFFKKLIKKSPKFDSLEYFIKSKRKSQKKLKKITEHIHD